LRVGKREGVDKVELQEEFPNDATTNSTHLVVQAVGGEGKQQRFTDTDAHHVYLSPAGREAFCCYSVSCSAVLFSHSQSLSAFFFFFLQEAPSPHRVTSAFPQSGNSIYAASMAQKWISGGSLTQVLVPRLREPKLRVLFRFRFHLMPTGIHATNCGRPKDYSVASTVSLTLA
jgi:hypothetical protein